MTASKPARADAPALTTPIALTDSPAARYRQRAEFVRAVADAFDQDTPQNRTTALIVAALRTAADDAEAMAGTLDDDERRIA